MRYAKIKNNDTVNGEGVSVSLWTQGCPHHCKGCFNQCTWDFGGGAEVPPNLSQKIIEAISANGIQRNFSVLGGEPLCDENKEFVASVITDVRKAFPHIKIYVWTGYTFNELLERKDETIKKILYNIDVLIDGKFEEDKKDLTLKLRGSSNQNIIYLGDKRNEMGNS